MTEAGARLEREGLADVVTVEDPAGDDRAEAVTEHILQMREAKGLTAAEAARDARDPHYFAAALVALGHADACVSGATAATSHVIRAGLHCVGLAPTVSKVCSMFLMVRGDEVLSYADCGVLPEPDDHDLVDIATITSSHHRLFTGEEPRVAFLSFSTKGSAVHPRARRMQAACERFREQHPTIVADGELQFDAAREPAVATRKAPDSPVAGRANVLVFPDLDAGNIAYKITERVGGFHALGPLLLGLGKPCLDLSRGCSADDIVNVAVIAAVMSQAEQQTSP